MKKVLFSIAAVAVFMSVKAQSPDQGSDSGIIYPKKFSITKPLRELALQNLEVNENSKEAKKESADRQHRMPYMVIADADAQPQGEDPVTQKTMGTKQLTGTIVNWVGLAGSGTPPDPTGAAGPNHFVQAVNTQYRIYTKTGGSVIGGGPFNLGTLLFGENAGDPIVMYDKFAQRWFISQFAESSNDIYIAISQTEDPTGAYYTYQYTSPQFPDYLKFSIWSDGYYMTSNQTSQKIFAFNRTAMLAGNASAASVYKSFSPVSGGGFFCPLSAYADGQLPPTGTPCPVFTYQDDAWSSASTDGINIYPVTVNWNGTPSMSIGSVTSLNCSAFDASYNSGWNDIPQPGTTSKLDGIGGVFTFRAQYRIWSGYNTVVLNMGVKVNSSTRSIRWFELHQDQNSGTWSIYQEGTYSPDADSRWCGSIAMDDNGSIALAYAKSGSSVSPSICYTGRNAGDPLGQMTYSEQTAFAGSGSQTFTNRFGDYSHTSLDPEDGTIFWHTGEYLSSGSQKTRIFSFRIPNPVGIEGNDAAAAMVSAYYSNGKIDVKAENIPYSEDLQVDLFDLSGRLLKTSKINAVSGRFDTSVDVSGIQAATYLIRVGKMNTSFQKVIKVVVQ